MAELKIPQFPPEMAHEQVVKAMGTRDAMILQTIVDKFGSEKAQKMIYPRLKEMGKQMAATAPTMGITGKDAMAIASFIHAFEKQMMKKIEGEPTEVSSNRVVKNITKCPAPKPKWVRVLIQNLISDENSNLSLGYHESRD